MQQSVLDVKITYCAPCGFTQRVLDVTAEILKEREIEHFVANWTLVPSSGGVFEVEVNGELVFSKKTLGRHAEPGEVRAAVIAKLNSVRTVMPE